MRKVDFEWYVMNDDFNKKEIAPYNIFNNRYIFEETNKLCVKYKRNKMNFEDFTEELRRIIMYELWSRCQYEIIVSSLFDKNEETFKKIDCYEQVLPNIKILAKYVLEEYYPQLKINLEKPLVEGE